MIGTNNFRHNDTSIAYDVAGQGPPLLLLHGFPQTRAMWTKIVPKLSDRFTVITADLRGYGESTKPTSVAEMSFRLMADDMLRLMDHLGYSHFHLAGHDRGGRAAHRLALDHPHAVRSLTVMDIVPTHLLLSNITHQLARAYYHWFFLAQPEPFPETMIGHDPDAYFERCLLGFGKASLSDFDPGMLDAYRTSWRDPDCIRAMCHDYRAAIDYDLQDDEEDLHRQVTCPALVLYGQDGAMAKVLDVPATWSDRLSDMTSIPITGGHFFPDQSPDETAKALRDFLTGL